MTNRNPKQTLYRDVVDTPIDSNDAEINLGSTATTEIDIVNDSVAGLVPKQIRDNDSAYNANDFLNALAEYNIDFMQEIKTILTGTEKISKAKGDIVLKILDKIFANPAQNLNIHQRQEQVKVNIDMSGENLTRDEWEMIRDHRAKQWSKNNSDGYQSVDKMRIDRST